MTGFSLKNIKADLTVGERLKEQRKFLGMDLATVAVETRISQEYLKALEESWYQKLPGEVYAKSFLKRYAGLLGLQTDELVARYVSEATIFKKTENAPLDRDVGKPIERVGFWSLLATPKLIRSLAISFLALSCVVYLGFKVQKIFAPPILELETPATDVAIEQKMIEIVGHSEIGAVVKINGQKILIDEAGNFKETLSLQEGANQIEITAKKKHSKVAEIQRQIVVINKES